ncbi:LysM peptidoglycan-binding domain-containing protein [Caryophanon tenue]|uniref:Peptidoglycan endopeptidase n=1 Tax=Caryophanon tenue TaxID=33978 RepID=A0A1C0Y6M8_9BACL|nr:LysM peptidoglycan-binding domain-containing protein [Caryophanon tenue]OCS82812.1 hypothetical protein A6M13_05270 [Caryophanon tenue]
MHTFTKKITAIALGGTLAFTGVTAASAATYTVKSGDSLSKIGKQYGVSYQSIMNQNGLRSTTIYPGQKLQIGGASASASTSSSTKAAASTTYTVKRGDTLSKIASRYGTTYRNIMNINGLRSTTIYVGQKLKVTGKASASSSTKASSASSSSVGSSNVVTNARKHLGTRYKFGGSSPSTGFDCSGFIAYVFKQSGKNIGRTTAAGYYNMSTKVSSPRVGDLVFFSGTYKRGISHVGIYIGNGQMISAASSGVKVDSVRSGYWGKYFTGYGRL